jgi:Zn finger protein HypA/HybF involved in hydrogenase expression
VKWLWPSGLHFRQWENLQKTCSEETLYEFDALYIENQCLLCQCLKCNSNILFLVTPNKCVSQNLQSSPCSKSELREQVSLKGVRWTKRNQIH